MASALGLFAIVVIGASRAVETQSVVGHTLLATIMALAIIEHLILVLPVTDTALWRWAVGRTGHDKPAAGLRQDDMA